MVTTTVRHPIELLEAFEHNTEPSTRISKETNKRQLKNIIATLKRQIDRMQLIFQTSLKIHDIKNDERTTLENEFRATRRQICLSQLDPAFRARYDDEFETPDQNSKTFAEEMRKKKHSPGSTQDSKSLQPRQVKEMTRLRSTFSTRHSTRT
jgi:phosphatidate phosphatase PAH1